jgi:hypothetical protein
MSSGHGIRRFEKAQYCNIPGKTQIYEWWTGPWTTIESGLVDQ